MNDKTYLTPEEAAALLGICRDTLRKLTEPRGPIKAIRLSYRCIRYPRQELLAWMEQLARPKQEE